MAEATALMGVGLAPEVAKRVGWRVAALTATSTTQGTGTVVSAAGENVLINLTTSGGATAVTLPAGAGVGDMVWVNLTTATAAVVFPPTGGQIANKAPNASVAVAVNALFIRTSTTAWASAGAL